MLFPVEKPSDDFLCIANSLWGLLLEMAEKGHSAYRTGMTERIESWEKQGWIMGTPDYVPTSSGSLPMQLPVAEVERGDLEALNAARFSFGLPPTPFRTITDFRQTLSDMQAPPELAITTVSHSSVTSISAVH